MADHVEALLGVFGVAPVDRPALICERVAAVTGHDPMLVAKAMGRFLTDPARQAGLERLVGPLPPWTEPSDTLDFLEVAFGPLAYP